MTVKTGGGEDGPTADQAVDPDGDGARDGDEGERSARLGAATEIAGWALAIGGPVFYALGRLMAETFFHRFGVIPEEIGLSYGSLVLPAATVAVAVVAVVALAAASGEVFAALWLVWVIVAPISFLLSTDRGWADIRRIGVILAIVGALALVGLAQAWAARGVALAGLAIGTVAFLLGTAWLAADRAADQALAGYAAQVRLGPINVPGVAARLVRVEGLTGGPAAVTGCVIHLGSSDGLTVLVVDGVTWRVPSDSIRTIAGVCELTDVVPEPIELPEWDLVVDAQATEAGDLGSYLPCGQQVERGEDGRGRRVVLAVATRGSEPRPTQLNLYAEEGLPSVIAERFRTPVERLAQCPQGWTQDTNGPAGELSINYSNIEILNDFEIDRTGVETQAWRHAVSVTSSSGEVDEFDEVRIQLRGQRVLVQLVFLAPSVDIGDAAEVVAVVADRIAAREEGS